MATKSWYTRISIYYFQSDSYFQSPMKFEKCLVGQARFWKYAWRKIKWNRCFVLQLLYIYTRWIAVHETRGQIKVHWINGKTSLVDFVHNFTSVPVFFSAMELLSRELDERTHSQHPFRRSCSSLLVTGGCNLRADFFIFFTNKLFYLRRA